MRFFVIVGVTMLVIAGVNLMQATVELSLRDTVYACSDLPKDAPFDVKEKCKRSKVWMRML